MLPTLNFFVGFKPKAPRSNPPTLQTQDRQHTSGSSGRGAQRLPRGLFDDSGRLRLLRRSFLELLSPVVLLEVLPAGRCHEAPLALDGAADEDRPGGLLKLEAVKPDQRVIDDATRLAVERPLGRVLAVTTAQDDRDEPPGMVVHARIGIAAADLVEIDPEPYRLVDEVAPQILFALGRRRNQRIFEV